MSASDDSHKLNWNPPAVSVDARDNVRAFFVASKRGLTLAALFLVILLISLVAGAQSQIDVPLNDTTRVIDPKGFVETFLSRMQALHPEIKMYTESRRLVETKGRVPYYEGATQKYREIAPGIDKLLKELEYGLSIRTTASDSLAREIEADLRTWVMSNEVRSVTPDMLLAKATVLAEGNVTLAMVYCWNILSKDWSMAGSRNFNPMTQKLFDITGESYLRDGAGQFLVRPDQSLNRQDRKVSDLELRKGPSLEFIITKRGDNFSTWYHFFGVMIFSSYIAEKTRFAFVGSIIGKLAALSEAKNYFQTTGRNLKRVYNDLKAATAGAYLWESIHRNRTFNLPDLKISRYLVRNEWFGERLNPVPRKGVPLLYSDKRWIVDPKYYDSHMSTDELKMRFSHALRFKSEVLDPVMLATSTDLERFLVGMDIYRKSGARDTALNELISSFHANRDRSNRARIIIIDFVIGRKLDERHTQGQIDFDRVEEKVDRIMELTIAESRKPKTCISIF